MNFFVLLVAIDTYSDPSMSLAGCVNDLNAMHSFLITHLDQSKNKVFIKTLINEQATRKNLISTFVEHFDQASNEDCCLFYFAGHGSRIPAPRGFYHLSNNTKLQSIVCYDSRAHNGYDLADKEISYLIWQVVKDKNIHFLNIMDCCYSHTNTRSVEKIRMQNPEKRSRPKDLFIGHSSYYQDDAGHIKAPVGRHISISACNIDETAKEISCANDQTRGAFTFTLLKTLREHGLRHSYSNLVQRVRLNLRLLNIHQSPQLMVVDNADANSSFLLLDDIIGHKPYYVYFDQWEKEWMINCGEINGITMGEASFPTLFTVLEGKVKLEVKYIYPDRSIVTSMPKGIDKDRVYTAHLLQQYSGKLSIAIDERTKEPFKQQLIDFLSKRSSDCFQLFIEGKLTKYKIYPTTKGLNLTSGNRHRELMQIDRSWDKRGIADLINRLNQIAIWEQLYKLERPTSTITRQHYQISMNRVVAIDSQRDNAMTELLDIDFPIDLSYYLHNDQWQEPAFQLELKNTSDQPLWFAVIYLDDRYGITTLRASELIGEGEASYLINRYSDFDFITHHVCVEDSYLEVGVNKISDYLKVIISTHQISQIIEFDQTPMKFDTYIETYKSSPNRPRIKSDDFTTELIELRITRPLTSFPTS